MEKSMGKVVEYERKPFVGANLPLLASIHPFTKTRALFFIFSHRRKKKEDNRL